MRETEEPDDEQFNEMLAVLAERFKPVEYHRPEPGARAARRAQVLAERRAAKGRAAGNGKRL